MSRRNVEDITLDEFLNFSDDDWEKYTNDELDYLFDKYASEDFDGVTIRELLERFGYSLDGFKEDTLDLSFSVDVVDSFIRRGKIVFVMDRGDELIVDKNSADRCVVMRGGGGGEWVYCDLGFMMSCS